MRTRTKILAKATSGFTLIEVVISLSIIMVLSIALTTLLRSSLDIRSSLAERAEVVHRISTAMQFVADDLQHTFIIPFDNLNFGTRESRKMKTRFRLELLSAGDELWLTTMNHKSLRANSYESDSTLVVYRLQDMKDSSGRTSLYRGEAKRLPENLEEEIPMNLVAKGIKTFRIRGWRGDEWSKDRWDTDKPDWRNKLPNLVYIDIEAWEIDPDAADKSRFDIENISTMALKSVVYLPRSIDSPEIKEGAISVRWDRFGEAIN